MKLRINHVEKHKAIKLKQREEQATKHFNGNEIYGDNNSRKYHSFTDIANEYRIVTFLCIAKQDEV